ncbi:hypothetical protein KQI74_14825 [Paenibacillus barcinonensis]|uniref:hypothetical protein n=1 Tax=Paenibacillus barcinonensis TaxID=198119 RepID=UPI001C121D3E|nr:hypothetical protein [Paenibacillus barcinonensis]MBU5353566.1 hypothetical protein [Paenibacillus barcinonensis]
MTAGLPPLGTQQTFAGGWALVLSLSSDFFIHRSRRWKSDAKLAHAAPSSLSLLVPHDAGIAQRTFTGGWALVLSLSSDFFLHRSRRWKSDAKLAHAAPSSPSLLVPHDAGCSRYFRSLAHIRLRAIRLAQRLWR